MTDSLPVRDGYPVWIQSVMSPVSEQLSGLNEDKSDKWSSVTQLIMSAVEFHRGAIRKVCILTQHALHIYPDQWISTLVFRKGYYATIFCRPDRSATREYLCCLDAKIDLDPTRHQELAAENVCSPFKSCARSTIIASDGGFSFGCINRWVSSNTSSCKPLWKLFCGLNRYFLLILKQSVQVFVTSFEQVSWNWQAATFGRGCDVW
jgi:hypothetical protein